MIVIHNSELLHQHEKHANKFVDIYEEAFPDENEREDFNTICDRIIKNDFKDDPKTFLCLNNSGGLIAEYYYSSNCILITYVVVNPKNRKKGNGSRLLQEGIITVLETIKNAIDKNVHAIFFEVNDPTKVKSSEDSMDPYQRLAFFKKLDAKYIDIPYVQPSLGGTRKRVSNLLLCCLPIKKEVEVIESKIIIQFLDSFYRELGVPEPTLDHDFSAMVKAIRDDSDQGKYFLKEMPHKKVSKFQFSNCAVSFHIGNSASGDPISYCPYFGSFERDLFSRRYQKSENTPYQTQCLTPYDPKTIELIFPQKISYVSEGRQETWLDDADDRVKVKVYLAITNFYNSNRSVLSLVIQPENTFSELDLVKLSSLFGSNQENSNLIDQIKFNYQGEVNSFYQLINRLFCNEVEIKLDMSNICSSIQFTQREIPGIDWDSYLQYLDDLYSSNNQKQYYERYNNDAAFRYFTNWLCGLTLGIFDFERMTFDEVLDAVNPIISYPNSSIIMNRANLISLSIEDSIFDECRNTIGISPYLIIPNILLVHNESLLSECYKTLSSHLKENRVKARRTEEVLSNTEVILSNELQNVYQYETERSIFEEGYQKRNLLQVREGIEKIKQSIESRFDRSNSSRRNYFELVITFLLIIVSLLQIEPFIRSTVVYVIEGNEISAIDRLEFYFYIILFIILGVLITLFGRSVYKN